MKPKSVLAIRIILFVNIILYSALSFPLIMEYLVKPHLDSILISIVAPTVELCLIASTGLFIMVFGQGEKKP